MPEFKRAARALCWGTVVQLAACVTPAPRLTGPIAFGPIEVPPSGFHQRCQTLDATTRLDFEFQAEPALLMVVEYRESGMALQPLRLEARSAEAGRFLPEATREYCLRRENPGAQPAQLRYRLNPK